MNKLPYEGLSLSSYDIVAASCNTGHAATLDPTACGAGDVPAPALCTNGENASGYHQGVCHDGSSVGERQARGCDSGSDVSGDAGCISGGVPKNPGSCYSGHAAGCAAGAMVV
jgi:hypothetical protein